jgi:aminoglycoside phosphotransferase (APT) family kinase protein
VERVPVVLSGGHDRLLVRVDSSAGRVVVKVHASDVEPARLAARLRLAADEDLRDLLLAPVRIPGATAAGLATRVRGRLVSVWPLGTPVPPDAPDAIPWEEAAVLLARLHAVPLPPAAPPASPVRRLDRAIARLARLPGNSAADDVHQAYAALPRQDLDRPMRPGRPAALVHGDWHLGQVVHVDGRDRPVSLRRRAASPPARTRLGPGGWRIIDVDDLGVGDPAWDLARPASWFAAGLIAPETWARFLGRYQSAGGLAAPPGCDPWAALDVPARAVTVQYAAAAVADSAESGEPLDAAGAAFVDCCRRMTRPVPSRRGPVGTLLTSSAVPVGRQTGGT